MIFRDRDQAARLLEEKLSEQLIRLAPKMHGSTPVICGIPRGAVPMAKIIADALRADLDVCLVHKFGHPKNPEYALGSVTEEGEVFLGIGAERLGLDERDIADSARIEISRLQAKRRLYTPHRKPIDVGGRVVVIVDDGIATGATALAAVRSVRDKGAMHVIVATPVASNEAIRRLTLEGAEVCVLLAPEVFFAVSQFYEDFSEVSDGEVVRILSGRRPEVRIHAGDVNLLGYLVVPDHPKGLVIFAHGSGSGRNSPRNQFVARILNDAGIATLLVDLLSEEESQERGNVFDVDLLTSRLSVLTSWAQADPQLAMLPVGYFGASTGGAAALKAAAEDGEFVRAVVSRGGRPDLVSDDLPLVKAPTLFIVGGNDEPVLSWNRAAFARLTCERDFAVVPEAGHLFEEPGGLERVAYLASRWFETHLTSLEVHAGLASQPDSAAGPEEKFSPS